MTAHHRSQLTSTDHLQLADCPADRGPNAYSERRYGESQGAFRPQLFSPGSTTRTEATLDDQIYQLVGRNPCTKLL